MINAILSFGVVSAKWGRWKRESFCHDGQYLVAQQNSKYDQYDEADCQYFCRVSLLPLADSYDWVSDHFCCGYREYNDGQTRCELFEGLDIRDQDMVENHYDIFSAMDFGSSEIPDTWLGAKSLQASFAILAAFIVIQ